MAAEIPDEEIPKDVLVLCRTMEAAGERAWIVGGCLRDILLGQHVMDWDLATTAQPRKVQQLFRRVIPTGIEHGTVTVVLHGRGYEVTTLRGEGAYTDGRRPDTVHFVSDIVEDLARRDFTVNAIAYDPLHHELIDPFGGLLDLERRVLRAVGDPIARFSEDGLRILRGARFTASLEGFVLDPDTEAAFRPTLPTYARVSHERVRDEWMKAMRARRPSPAFVVMERTAILETTFPELSELARSAPEAFRLSLAATDACRGGALLRHATLFHRLGEHRPLPEGGVAEAAARAQRASLLAGRFLKDFRYSNAERETVTHLLACSAEPVGPDASDADIRRFLKRVEPPHVPDLFELWRAVAEASGDADPGWLGALRGRVEGALSEGLVLGPKDLAIGGNDLMAVLSGGQGPHLGEIMRLLVERVIDDPALNQPATLLRLARELEPVARATTARRRGGG